jgi:hypothetical protein
LVLYIFTQMSLEILKQNICWNLLTAYIHLLAMCSKSFFLHWHIVWVFPKDFHLLSGKPLVCIVFLFFQHRIRSDFICNQKICIKKNSRIHAKELKITPILKQLLEYERNWIKHVNRMPRNRLPRIMKRYSPAGNVL